MRQPFCEAIHFAWRDAKNFGDFAYRQPRVHGDETSDHCHVGLLPSPRNMSGAPALVHVVEQLVAACPANIDVDVRAIAALLVQKSLEIKSPAQRTDARNSQP